MLATMHSIKRLRGSSRNPKVTLASPPSIHKSSKLRGASMSHRSKSMYQAMIRGAAEQTRLTAQEGTTLGRVMKNTTRNETKGRIMAVRSSQTVLSLAANAITLTP